jgi:hypothetical protein
LNGVGIEFEVPDVVRFKAAVAYHELSGNHRFDGSLMLALDAMDLQIDGQIVIGSTASYTYLALYLDAELPAGIPLWATGLGLYGMAGLFALNMEPGKTQSQDWYAIPPSGGDWFHQNPTGVSGLTKWTNREGSLGFGAGVTIGTVADNGFTFAGKVLLVIVFPGPIVMIDGAANLLQERAKLNDDPLFHVLAVLDNRAGTITLGLDAKYKYAKSGELIDLHGSAEAFFSDADASIWHIYLGERDPETKRIRASLFKLFDVEAYLMADDSRTLALGARIGLAKHWQFGPLALDLQAWIEGNALVSYKPAHFHGDLTLHGNAQLKAFGVGASLTVDSQFTADDFNPFYLVGHIHADLKLPWPLPSFSADATIEWPPDPTPPQLPVPLKEIAVEHFKVKTSWPLVKGSDLLAPNYDDGEGFLGPPQPGPADLTAGPPAGAPVVPPDARPHLTFTRAVNDDALVGVNAQPRTPEWEQIGDPSRTDNPLLARYGLAEVAVDKWDMGTSTWETMARKGSTANPSGVPELFGSWAPVPSMPGGTGANPGQVKLWLWSKSAFDYTRHTSGSWADWFGSAFPDYPCAGPVIEAETCYDFQSLDPTAGLTPPWTVPGSGIRLGWFSPVPLYSTVVSQPVDGLDIALCFQGPGTGDLTQLPTGGAGFVTVLLDQPADEITLTLLSLTGAEAFAFDTAGARSGPFAGGTSADPKLVIAGHNLREILVQARTGFCLFRICVKRPAPGSASESAIAAYDQHLRDALDTWSAQGNVLEPWRNYRLKVVTTVESKDSSGKDQTQTQVQLAYFQTQGPPGLANLSLPVGAASASELTLVDSNGNTIGVDGSPSSQPVLKSDLNSLAPYVEQTVPPTVPAAGERPQLPRPVYRGYDVGVKFNEDYVDLLYRLGRRDLALHLYDANNRPVRDAQGRLIVLGNPWGVADQLSLSDSDTRWIETVNQSDCAALDVTVIPHNTTLSAASDQQVLSPDFVYEARLVPLLFHEDFAGYPAGAKAAGPAGTLGAWWIHDDGSVGAPSVWKVGATGAPQSYYIAQTAPITGPPNDPLDPRKPGTMLLTGDVSWTDVRLSAYVRSSTGGAIGVVFRYQSPSAYYRFSMDRTGGYRRLVRVVAGAHTILAEDPVAYPLGTDQLITVEAAGPSLRAYVDGDLVFAVEDAALTTGAAGLYCRGDSTARFSDVRVDDFRAGAPVAYRFQFTTSTASNFLHHLHSFDDRRWFAVIDPDPSLDSQVSAALAAAVALTDAQSDAEAKAYEALVPLALGQAAAQYAQRVEATRIERSGNSIAWLVRSPEPIDWTRTSLEISVAPAHTFVPVPPGALKLVDLTAGSGLPADASTTVLVREPTQLDGQRVDWLRMPGAPASTPRPALFTDSFDTPGGLLFNETFGPNALDAYTIVDQGTQFAPSSWSVTSRGIVQSSPIFGGALQAAEDGKPGTMAVTGSAQWANVRITAGIEPWSFGAIGIVLRYTDPDNYYRLAVDADLGYRRVVRCVAGVTTVLWEDSFSLNSGQRYKLVVDAFGPDLVGYIDGALMFHIPDSTLTAGKVGLYSWLNPHATFSELSVESLDRNPVLWNPALTDMSGLTVTDDPAATGGPSAWAAANRELAQTSAIGDITGSLLTPGTWASGGDPGADDVRISLRLRSDATGAIGVMFRLRNDANYYRISLDGSAGQRRLVKVTGGTTSLLWEDSAQGYAAGRWYQLTIDAVADSLNATLDGTTMFSISDADIPTGQVALYCSGCTAARFDSLCVYDLARRAGNWRLRDETGSSGPSRWSIQGGSLLQSAATGDGGPPFAGTLALVDGRSWADTRLTVRLQAEDPHPVGVVLRYSGPGDYYRFFLDANRSQRRLDAFVNGAATTLWSDSGGFDVGTPLTLTFDAAGDQFTGYVNGQFTFRVNDDSLQADAIGVYCSQNPAVRVQHVEVEAPPLEAFAILADRFDTGDRSDWTVVDQGTVSGPSSWVTYQGALRQTSPIHDTPVDAATPAKEGTMVMAGDTAWTDVIVAVRLGSPVGGTVGTCFRYTDPHNYYRYSMDSSLEYRRLVKCLNGNFTTLWEDTVAYDTSRTHDLVVVAAGAMIRGYIDGAPAFSVEDTDLTTGAVALYSWNNTDARFSAVRVLPASAQPADWTIDDGFQILRTGRWTFADESTTGGTSDWHVDSNSLVQTVTVGGGAGEGEPEMPGTYATAGDPSTTDGRVVARARSNGDGALGLVARFTDTSNYYRLSWDAPEGTLHLIKKVGGTVTSLWTSQRTFDTTREYLMTVDLVGGQITCWIDGELLCTLDDSDLATGKAGVYTAAEPTARFAEFRLGPPAWSHLYRFTDEPPPADGRRFEIHGGAPDPSLAAPPGSELRFAAGPGERGWALPDGIPIDLRLVAADNSVTHTRRFLPAAEYSTASAAVLRKADGTGFFLVPTGGATTIDPGTYRLDLTYRRDNTAHDAGSLVLSQAGDKSDEHAQLDVPWDTSTSPATAFKPADIRVTPAKQSRREPIARAALRRLVSRSRRP